MVAAGRDLQLRALEVLENARNYNRWITSLILPHLGDHPVELGSGLGYQTELLLGRASACDGQRADAGGAPTLRDRFAGDARVDCWMIDFTSRPRATTRPHTRSTCSSTSSTTSPR